MYDHLNAVPAATDSEAHGAAERLHLGLSGRADRQTHRSFAPNFESHVRAVNTPSRICVGGERTDLKLCPLITDAQRQCRPLVFPSGKFQSITAHGDPAYSQL